MDNNGWTVNLEGWTTMAPVFEWQTAARSGDFEVLTSLMQQVVKAWPFEPAPDARESYSLISPVQFREALKEVGGKVGSLFRG